MVRTKDNNSSGSLANWKRAFASGYRDGRMQRARGTAPPGELLVANSDYALGYQAGYFSLTQMIPDEAL